MLPPSLITVLTSDIGIADRVKNFAVIYVCDLDQVPDFKQMYELYDPVTLMFFFRNKHMMCDFGTGNNNKLNWVLEDKQELIDIIETIYRGAKKGRGLVVSPKGRNVLELPLVVSKADIGCRLLYEISLLGLAQLREASFSKMRNGGKSRMAGYGVKGVITAKQIVCGVVL